MEIRKKDNQEVKSETPSRIELFVDKVTGKIKWLDRFRKEKVLATENYVDESIANIPEPPAPTIPTLAQVTEAGQFTDLTIENIDSLTAGTKKISVDYLGVRGYRNLDTTPVLNFSLDNNDDRSVLTVSEVHNSRGEIKPYKSYVASLVQPGGTVDPTVTVKENTIGNIVWTRTNIGRYQGTLTGAFPLAGFWKQMSIGIYQIDAEVAGDLMRQNDNIVEINIYDNTFTNVEGFTGDIEIRIYD